MISANGGAGVVARSVGDGHPRLTVSGCNIFGNAAEGGVGGLIFREDHPLLRAVDGTSSPASSTESAEWNAPATPYEVYARFRKTADRAEGRLRGEGFVALRTYTADAEGWVPATDGVFSVYANQLECCGRASMYLDVVRQWTPGIVDQALTVGVYAEGHIDARGNFWGVFPDVQPLIHEVQVGSADFTGFQPFALDGVGPRALP